MITPASSQRFAGTVSLQPIRQSVTAGPEFRASASTIDARVSARTQAALDAMNGHDAVRHAPVGADESRGGGRAPDPTNIKPVTDADKKFAIDQLNRIHDYFESLGVSDTEGNSTELPVYFKADFPNAAYVQTQDGREAIVIGNDARTGSTYARAIDVLAHEYTHRVVAHTVGLEHGGQTGVMNESLSDTFASAIDTDDWLIAEDIVPGGIRSMDDPSNARYTVRFPDGTPLRMPSHMKDIVSTEYDDGGVHINVGIPNKAASIIGMALGRDEMAKIYMDTMKDHLKSTSGIVDAAKGTLAAAINRYGADSREVGVVRDAWDAVGISLEARKAAGSPSRDRGTQPMPVR